ncbi:hypothetical protein ACJX0J_035702, partial [Zea mays]
ERTNLLSCGASKTIYLPLGIPRLLLEHLAASSLLKLQMKSRALKLILEVYFMDMTTQDQIRHTVMNLYPNIGVALAHVDFLVLHLAYNYKNNLVSSNAAQIKNRAKKLRDLNVHEHRSQLTITRLHTTIKDIPLGIERLYYGIMTQCISSDTTVKYDEKKIISKQGMNRSRITAFSKYERFKP